MQPCRRLSRFLRIMLPSSSGLTFVLSDSFMQVVHKEGGQEMGWSGGAQSSPLALKANATSTSLHVLWMCFQLDYASSIHTTLKHVQNIWSNLLSPLRYLFSSLIPAYSTASPSSPLPFLSPTLSSFHDFLSLSNHAVEVYLPASFSASRESPLFLDFLNSTMSWIDS